MRITSVNIGREEPLANAKSGKTGIFKRPVLTPVSVTLMGLDGDHISDKQNHGGKDQAVYIYGVPDYVWWSHQLGRPIAPGTFGENLTISDLESASAHIGDRFRIGQVLLEVTAPRIPCITIARRMGDPDFVKRFQHAERPGLYCRVLETGHIRVDDLIMQEAFTGNAALTAVEMFRSFFRTDLDEATLRRYLVNPIASRARVDLELKLEKLLS